jgi:hypothetical protein
MEQKFDRKKHVYRNDGLVELIKDAVRFFSGTPVHTLPPPEKFTGCGIYALYYIGKNLLYEKYFRLNRLAYNYPIYVGKAVPKGWRQSRMHDEAESRSDELYGRLAQHRRNVDLVDLSSKDFMCRFVILENEASDMIGTIEAALIKIHKPLWNSVLDGFGNHDPGKGRYDGAKPDWDVIHPGRKWAPKCSGKPNSKKTIIGKIATHMKALGDS